MAKRDKVFSTAGDAERMGLAMEALIATLGRDPRVQRAYVQWCLDHQLLGVTDAETFRARLLRNRDGDLERLRRLVDDLKLPYRWLAQELLRDFGLTIIGEATIGETPSAQYVPVTDGLPSGRSPKNDGEHIARDVEWLYRTRVKVPPDSISAIAKDYAQQAERDTDARSVVQYGIERAAQLLSALDVEPEE